MVKINTIMRNYLQLLTKKKLTGLKEQKFREGGVGVITFEAPAKKNIPNEVKSIYSTKANPRVHIATLTSKGDVFLFKKDFKYLK